MRVHQKNIVEGEVKIDLFDKKILSALAIDARMPYTQIGRVVRLSNDSVKYRIINMEKRGVIQGYRAVISSSALGFDTYHIFLKLKKMNDEVRKGFIATLKSYPFVKAAIEFVGKYDFEISIIARNVEQADEFISKILDDSSVYLSEHFVMIISKAYSSKVFPDNFIKIKQVSRPPMAVTLKELDGTNLKLLKILSEDASEPLLKIAQELSLSAEGVKYRIKALQESKVITKFSPFINYSALGYTIYLVLMNMQNLSKGSEGKLSQFFKTDPNILWAVKGIGRYNLLFYVCAKRSEDLHSTILRMRELFSTDIIDYETFIAYEEYIYNYFPDIMSKQP